MKEYERCRYCASVDVKVYSQHDQTICVWCTNCGALTDYGGSGQTFVPNNFVPDNKRAAGHFYSATLEETKYAAPPAMFFDGQKWAWLCPDCNHWIPMGKSHKCQ